MSSRTFEDCAPDRRAADQRPGAYREIQILIPQVMKKHDLPMPPMEVAGEIVPIELKALLEEEELSEEEEERLLVIFRREIRRLSL